MLRGVLESLQWPASETGGHLLASVSMLQGQVGQATIGTLLEAASTVKFARKNKDVGIIFRRMVKDLQDLVFGSYTDAALATRPDGSSQGGRMVFATNKDALAGHLAPFSSLLCRSKKLATLQRSSLGSEARAAGDAVDELEWVKGLFAQILDPTFSPLKQPMTHMTESPLVTDAKALYDSALKENPAPSVNDKRTALEVNLINQRLRHLNGFWKWVSSERQIADGLTKLAARQLLADRLRRAMLRLSTDKAHVAAKKKTKEEREQAKLFLD